MRRQTFQWYLEDEGPSTVPKHSTSLLGELGVKALSWRTADIYQVAHKHTTCDRKGFDWSATKTFTEGYVSFKARVSIAEADMVIGQLLDGRRHQTKGSQLCRQRDFNWLPDARYVGSTAPDGTAKKVKLTEGQRTLKDVTNTSS